MTGGWSHRLSRSSIPFLEKNKYDRVKPRRQPPSSGKAPTTSLDDRAAGPWTEVIGGHVVRGSVADQGVRDLVELRDEFRKSDWRGRSHTSDIF